MAFSRTLAGVGLCIGIFLLTLGTAVIHLYLGLSFGITLFVLNGLGYLGLLAALQLSIPQMARFRGIARSGCSPTARRGRGDRGRSRPCVPRKQRVVCSSIASRHAALLRQYEHFSIGRQDKKSYFRSARIIL